MEKIWGEPTSNYACKTYYGSGTADEQEAGTADTADTGHMLYVHSPDVSTFLYEMTSWPPS